MGRIIGRAAWAVLGVGLLVAACSGSSKSSGNPRERVCEPGSKSCDGLNVKVCSDDGSERTIEQTCSPSQTCADGACAETACVPNTKFCKDGSVWKCDSTGSGNTLSQSCAKSQFCREEDGSASCSDQACTAGQAVCDGELATTCQADGSGPKPGGIDCAASKQACFEGKCQDTACSSGMKVCKDEDVYLCAKNGTDMSLLADCQAGSVCDGAKGACVPKVCDIGSIGCDGTRAVKCNAFGSEWDPAANDCATENQVCVAGVCKKQTCTPSSTFCQGGNVFQCDAAGVTSTAYQTCYANYQHCTSYAMGNYAYCEENRCLPNQPACDGNIARVCNADGSWPQAGADCGSEKFCDPGTGTCKARVCEQGAIFCKDGDVYGCDWLGSHADLYQACPTDTTCKVTNGNYSCVPLPCIPDEPACLGNKVGTCAADGQSLAKVTEDCTATASICGPDNKCAKSVVDSLGVAEDANTEYSGYVIGDVVEVSSARKLAEMQINLVLPAPRELRWVIFEETSDTLYTAKQDWVVPNQSGTGFFSSGPISYALKAGKTYLFAVVITGGNTSIAYLDTAPFALNTSFGTSLGRIEGGYSSVLYAAPDYNYIYQMKLTTTP